MNNSPKKVDFTSTITFGFLTIFMVIVGEFLHGVEQQEIKDSKDYIKWLPFLIRAFNFVSILLGGLTFFVFLDNLIRWIKVRND